MNRLCVIFLTILSLGAVSAVQAQSAAGSTFVQRVPLDPSRPYFVPTHPAVTVTVSFPHEIDGFDGWAFTTDPQRNQGDFYLSFTEGNNYLSFVPVGRGDAVRNLNVVIAGKVISLIAYPVKDQRQAPTAIQFEEQVPARDLAAAEEAKEQSRPSSVIRTYKPPARPFEHVTPTRLLGMLDTMKLLAQLDAQDGQEERRAGTRGRRLEDAAKAMPHLTIVRREGDSAEFGFYRIRLLMVVRNNRLDVVAFTCVIENTSGVPLQFDPESFGVRVGAAYYRQVIGDFQPDIRPGKSEIAFFAFAGSPDGRPNYLDPEQEFLPSLELRRPRVNPGADLIKATIQPAVEALPPEQPQPTAP